MEESEGPLLTGTVEVDETYVGERQKGRQFSGRSSESTDPNSNKRVVIGWRQRGGPLQMIHSKDVTSETIGEIIRTHVATGEVEAIMTMSSACIPKP